MEPTKQNLGGHSAISYHKTIRAIWLNEPKIIYYIY